MKTRIINILCLAGQIAIGQVEVKKPLADFNQLTVQTNIPIVLQRSDQGFISFTQKDSGSSQIPFELVGGKLLIKSSGKGAAPEKITIGYTQLNGVQGYGAASIKSDGVLKSDDFELMLQGASRSKIELNCKLLNCVLQGASTSSLFGQCSDLTAVVSGASALKAEELVSENAMITASGASTAKVNVTNKLSGNVSGASLLKYTGNPKNTLLNQSGVSTVKNMDLTSLNGSADVSETVSAITDSIRSYTLNGKYEIVIHDRPTDTTASWYKRKRDGKIRKKNWAGVDLFENGYMTPDNNISMPANADYMTLNYGTRNLGFGLNLFEKDFRFAKGRLQVVTGLGFSFNYYSFKNKTVLNGDSSYTSNTYNTAVSFSKNRLRESFATVPLLLELNTSRRDHRNFHIAAGVIGGIKLGSSTKQEYSQNNHEYDNLRRADYNLFPFKLDATVRVGYGNVTLFATYSLTPLFQYNKGPELYPFSVGIRLVPFN